jgi:hypothetical protein
MALQRADQIEPRDDQVRISVLFGGMEVSTRNLAFLLQIFVAINFSARIAFFENGETRRAAWQA